MRLARLLSTTLRSSTKWTVGSNSNISSTVASTWATLQQRRPVATFGVNHNVTKSEPTDTVPGQLPTTKFDRVILDVEKLLHNSNYNLQRLISDEVAMVTQILQKLIGTNRPLSEIKKLYQPTSQHLIRGLMVLLMSKAVGHPESSPDYAEIQDYGGIAKSQWMLAKIVEMLHMALLIHREIRNIDQSVLDTSHLSINASNKVSVLYGDFLWAKSWQDLSDLGHMEVTEQMVTVLVNSSQGQFLSTVELMDAAERMSLNYWLDKNFMCAASLPAFGFRSAMRLAKVDDEVLLRNAYEFGQNFGFFTKAHEEIRWFTAEEPNPLEALDFCSLPAVLHVQDTGKTLHHLIPNNQSQQQQQQQQQTNSEPTLMRYNYRELHSMVRNGPALDHAKEVMDTFRQKSLEKLQHIPDSKATELLNDIVNSMSQSRF